MDWPGAILACAGLFLIVFGFSHAETVGWTAALTIGSLVAGVLVLARFVLAEAGQPPAAATARGTGPHPGRCVCPRLPDGV